VKLHKFDIVYFTPSETKDSGSACCLPVYVFKLVSFCAQLAEMSREDSVIIPPSLTSIFVNQKESTFCIRDYMLMKY